MIGFHKQDTERVPDNPNPKLYFTALKIAFNDFITSEAQGNVTNPDNLAQKIKAARLLFPLPKIRK